MTNSKPLFLDVTAANGVPFRVVLLLDGKSTNFPASNRWRGKLPLVEFYDARYRNVRGFTPDGQFVSRYYLETLLSVDPGHERSRRGLDLEGGVPDWTIDAITMRTVAAWLRTHTRPPTRTWDEEQEEKRELVRTALREVLPGTYISPGAEVISLEAAAELLDIIEAQKAALLIDARPRARAVPRNNGPFSDADLARSSVSEVGS